MRKSPSIALACTLALGALSGAAGAQPVDATEKAVLVDSRGAPVVTSDNRCWHMAFGPPPSWTAACHPAPVAQYVAPPARPEPAQAAAGAPAPPPVVYEKVTFDANILFDSDSSELRAAGRDSLDEFARSIQGLDAESIVAIGYADRMGSEAANQVLSEERVGAVKAYLVGKGIAAERVRTSAWGETRPDTARADCKDANNAANVACMQPDRHVFIEVSGTRIAR